jgi:hypothetical protein
MPRRKLVRQRTLDLWWDTRTHAAGEEAEGVEATTAGFDMGASCLAIARLGALQEGGNAFQVGGAGFGIKRQCGDQRVGGVADLAQREPRIFPPAAAPSGGPERDGSLG